MLTVPRICSYPSLTDGTLDYAEGNSYKTERAGGSQEDLSICIEHCVTGGNLVAELLLDGRAAFACTVIAACSAYREVFVAPQPPKQINGAVMQRQEITCDGGKVSHPIIFQPHVVTRTGVPPFKAEPRHGLGSFWMDGFIEFPPAAMIAAGPFWNPLNEVRSILWLQKDKENRLPAGCFEVDDVVENGFYFRVLVAPELYESLRRAGSAIRHRDSIYAAAFSQGLQILQDKYHTDEAWKEYPNLRALYAKLREKNLPVWTESNFSPNQTVAAFHPHKLDTDPLE